MLFCYYYYGTPDSSHCGIWLPPELQMILTRSQLSENTAFLIEICVQFISILINFTNIKHYHYLLLESCIFNRICFMPFDLVSCASHNRLCFILYIQHAFFCNLFLYLFLTVVYCIVNILLRLVLFQLLPVIFFCCCRALK